MNLPELKKRQHVETWEPFMSSGKSFNANLYAHEDGRRHLYFWQDGEDIRGREHSRNVTRIGYRSWPDGVQFLGMTVEFKMRGQGMGQALLAYFMDVVAKHDAPFAGTGKIHKPLIALSLQKAGLKPESEDLLVEILPKSKYTPDSDVPDIHIVNGPVDMASCIDGSAGGGFYKPVHPDQVVKTYPINDPSMTVAINTCYYPVPELLTLSRTS